MQRERERDHNNYVTLVTLMITLCKLNFTFYFIKILKKNENKKEAGTDFVLLSRSRNMTHENLFE